MNNPTDHNSLLAKLLLLYPRGYREKYGEELLQTTADMLADASAGQRLAICLRIILNFPFNVIQVQLQYAGGILRNETPRYVKRNGLIGAALLVPCLIALTFNALDKTIGGQTLYRSWLWNAPFIQIWILRLPELVLLFIAVTYLYFLYHKRPAKSGIKVKRFFDIKHAWPILTPGMLAFGILFLVAFHDVGQCWALSPSYLSSHFNQALQCTVRNQSIRIFEKSRF